MIQVTTMRSSSALKPQTLNPRFKGKDSQEKKGSLDFRIRFFEKILLLSKPRFKPKEVFRAKGNREFKESRRSRQKKVPTNPTAFISRSPRILCKPGTSIQLRMREKSQVSLHCSRCLKAALESRANPLTSRHLVQISPDKICSTRS